MPSAEVILTDTELTVSELVRTVRQAAEDVEGGVPERALRIVFTADVPDATDRPFVAGQQRGSTVWVRVDGVAMPTRTMVHELAHAFAPGTGHGETFRSIYLAAITEVYDEATASREARRLAWVYDKCYADASCPVVRRRTDGTDDARRP